MRPRLKLIFQEADDDVRVRQFLDQFLDEVLFAVLDGYERNVGGKDGRR